MDILTIFIPVVSTHITSTFCPYSEHNNIADEFEPPYQRTMRTMIWPVLSAFLGFSWLIARNKSIAKKATNTAQTLKKGFLNVFKNPTTASLDAVYMILIVLINFYLWFSMCEKREMHSTYTLIGLFIAMIAVVYMVASYTSGSLLLLTPLLMYVFLLLQDIAIKEYKNYNVEVDVNVEITETESDAVGDKDSTATATATATEKFQIR